MQHPLATRGMLFHGMSFDIWDALIPGTDIIAPMMQITSPADHPSYCDVDILEAHQISIWFFSADGRPASVVKINPSTCHWRIDRRHIHIPIDDMRLMIVEGQNFRVADIRVGEVVLDRQMAGA